MSATHHHLGIDLGTTNSAQAVHDETSLKLVRNAEGAVLTPSVVRIDGRGRVMVGAKARGFLATDPENTRAEFKRLMGSAHELEFPLARVKRSPSALAAEVLKALRSDFADQLGHEPMRAVISVPALFELPQIAATSEAARLAGFERVEFIQEPIASAMAAGWSVEKATTGSWLVYDLGGGTFDASLLESREGLLRVVGHDGNNFLGGRDIDQGLADWVIARLAETGVRVEVTDPRMAAPLRRLRAACELVKIELTRTREADLQIEGLFEQAGKKVDIDIVVERSTLETIVMPIVDRSLDVCLRLLEGNGLAPDQLERVVLVGGPTVMPQVRARISSVLPAATADAGDPMTLVAEGAALFALAHSISTRSESTRGAAKAPSVWLQYAAVSSDLHPFVVGKVSSTHGGDAVVAVVLERAEGSWSSEKQPLDAERSFAAPVDLVSRKRNTFVIVGVDKDGRRVPLDPPELTITHGVSLGDPPLSRTLGVALADNDVMVFFEKGSPLPIRRTFTLRTVETVSPGNQGFALRVPIVQGELLFAHLCRLVGTLEIPADGVRSAIPAGSDVEVTLELDRGGRLIASARIAVIDQQFQHVAHLVAPDLAVDAMRSALDELARRGSELRGSAFRGGDPKTVRALLDMDKLLAEARHAIDLAEGGDPDAGERARRLLLDIDGLITDVDTLRSWPKLEEETRFRLALESGWIGQYGTDTERTLFATVAEAVDRALRAKNASEVRRQLMAARRLGSAAYFRSPDAWPAELDHVASRIHELSEPMKGRALVESGRRALAGNDKIGVEQAVRALWQLLPPSADQRRLGHDSGVR